MYYVFDQSSGNIVGFKVSGMITASEMDQMCQLMKKCLSESERVRLLVVIEGFRGLTAAALEKKLSFAWKYYTCIDRMTVVARAAWTRGWVRFIRNFISIELKEFEPSQTAAAWAWIKK
ncbi:MAG: STAS/SEC14 domain-containing protein [Desulfobacteraceae bacterium]